MKFARYLKDTQTPEWKKAYIDYRGLKKQIAAIRKAQETGASEAFDETTRSQPTVEDVNTNPSRSEASRAPSNYGSTGETPPLSGRVHIEIRSSSPPPVELPDPAIPLPTDKPKSTASVLTDGSCLSIPPEGTQTRLARQRIDGTPKPALIRESNKSVADVPGPSIINSPGRFLANLRRRQSAKTIDPGSSSSSRSPLPLSILLPTLTPLERQFFDKLDKELEKVDEFYRARESEAIAKWTVLKEQLKELQDHRKLFYEAKAAESKWTSLLPKRIHDHLVVYPHPSRNGKTALVARRAMQLAVPSKVHSSGIRHERSVSPSSSLNSSVRDRLDPDEYRRAKKELKKAILEYYRGLELLNNYRVLNLTGFRKALKKLEKTIKVSVQQSYMQEKVEACSFSSGEVIEKMIKDSEDVYASRFESGDLKKARVRLRATMQRKSHHFSAFRSGLYLGIALPAFVDGIYKSFQSDTRADIPWDALLLVYATLVIPVFFSLLVGINIWVWSRARINYAFIFELDVRSQLDSREYFELPSFLLGTLCYAFWLSFNRIGSETIAPTTWPLVWLVFALAVIIDPLALLFPKSRWWLVRKVCKLLMSGTRPVEFTDFWLGDQFCSLVFTLSNLYFLGCSYQLHWKNVWVTCSTAKHWGVPFALSILPLTVRAVQSFKRYFDSRLYTHLINAGKYISGILFYAFYFLWRHNNEAHNFSFVLFCLFATNYSVYACAWDILMDWSLCKRPAQHPLLRKDLVYSSNYPVYYVAILTNVIIRFAWIIYIPGGNFNFNLRAFIAAFLEILRRWQWNFFRLENEHIGNTDQYRVTREVPLPYSIDDVDNDSDEGGDLDEEYNSKRSWRESIRMGHLATGDDDEHDSRQP